MANHGSAIIALEMSKDNSMTIFCFSINSYLIYCTLQNYPIVSSTTKEAPSRYFNLYFPKMIIFLRLSLSLHNVVLAKALIVVISV